MEKIVPLQVIRTLNRQHKIGYTTLVQRHGLALLQILDCTFTIGCFLSPKKAASTKKLIDPSESLLHSNLIQYIHKMNSIIPPLWAGKKVCKPPTLPGTTLPLGLEMQKGQQLCGPEMQRQNCMSTRSSCKNNLVFLHILALKNEDGINFIWHPIYI